jgi:acetoin:2,6-dichlorophenolindophenol oxidoreductase subunit alpha
VLFETLNLSVLWNLPIVFVCENNGYAATVPVSVATAVASIADRARGFGMHSEEVDGMDCRAVRAAAELAVARAREGDGPSFLECKTYRFVGHHTAERLMKLGYRRDDEVERWKQRDPLALERRTLLDSGEATEAEIEAVEASVEETLAHAVAYARAGTQPDPRTARDYMYASGLVPVGGWTAT